MRVEAMAASHCDCIDLSTQEGDPWFREKGDFCLVSSARILCEVTGMELVCDANDLCDLANFTCPRHSYDSFEVPLKGFGNQCSEAPRSGLAYNTACVFLAAAAVLWSRPG